MPETIAIKNLSKNTYFANTLNSFKSFLVRLIAPVLAFLMICISFIIMDEAPHSDLGFCFVWLTVYFLLGYIKFSKSLKDRANDIKRLMKYVKNITKEDLREAIEKNDRIVQ